MRSSASFRRKAEQALDAIRHMIAPKASVLRDGKRASVAAAELVPGDIVLLEPGDQVPADLRLLRTRALLVDEAILTGESVAAENRTSRWKPTRSSATAARWPIRERWSRPDRNRDRHRDRARNGDRPHLDADRRG